MEGTWPLVGRDEELSFVASVLDAGGSVVLAGEAGCGKTRLAFEALTAAGDRGVQTEWIVATAATSTLPFGAFAHLAPPDLAEPIDRLRLQASVRAALSPPGSGRLLLGIDDAQHLDPDSATFVHRIAHDGVQVLITLRSGHEIPEPLAALWHEGTAQRVEMQPLGWPDVYALLERALGATVEGQTLHRLWTATAGNVLYLRELVLGGRESGALALREGVWRWHGPLVAPRLVETIRSRLSALPSVEREALDLLAVGELVRVEVIETTTEPEIIGSLERRGLVVAEPMGDQLVLRLAHPLYGEVLRAALAAMQARSVKRRLASAIRACGATGPRDRIHLATWSLDLGEEVDAAALIQASRDAADPAEGLRLARKAVAAGGGAEAALNLATKLYIIGEPEDAERVLRDLSIAAEDTGGLEAREASVRAMNLFFGLGRPDEALVALDEAIRPDLDVDSRATLLSRRAQILLFAGRTAEAVEVAAGVEDVDSGGDMPLFRAAWVAGVANALQGRAASARAIVERRLPDVPWEQETGPMLAGWLMTVQFLADWFAGRLDGADAIAKAGYQQMTSYPRSEMHGIAALARGRVDLVRGRAGSAARRMAEAATLLREYDTTGFVVFALAGLAQARALLGDADAAQAAVDEAVRRRKAVRIFDADIELARAWAMAAAGAAEAAAKVAIGAADIARTMAQGASEVSALHDALRLGAPAETGERLIVAAGEVEGDLAAARVLHAQGLVRDDPATVEEAAARFEEIGALLLAAEAAAQAAGMHSRAGDPRRAQHSTMHARSLASRCEGARTPLLWHAGTAASLTRREREVARLAASGLTNKEIAERLVLSARTVDNHLHQAYAKLGVVGRRGLAAALSLDA